MALQFRRGAEADLPHPSDAAIGEPLFTTDEGKLRIKKADGTYAVIGSGTSTGDLDLSGIAAGAMVKVNGAQDGFVAAAGGDLPSHTHTIANVTGLADALDAKAPASHTHPVAILQAGSAELGDVVKFDGTNWVAGAITVSGDTYDSQAFNDAVERELLVNLPTSGGVLDIAQESTLLDLGNDIDGIDTRVTALENAPDGVDLGGFADGAILKVDASSGSGETLAEAVAGTDYIAPSDITKLRAVFPEADLPASAGTTTGYWKWTYADGSGTWAIDTNQVTAPDEINGGNATSFGA